jgi:hypothetical protein
LVACDEAPPPPPQYVVSPTYFSPAFLVLKGFGGSGLLENRRVEVHWNER